MLNYNQNLDWIQEKVSIFSLSIFLKCLSSGHLKLTATFYSFSQFDDENVEPPPALSPSKKRKGDIDSGSSKEKKRKRSSFKNTGKKRVQIIGILPDVQENYNNCKMLFDLSGVNKMKYTLACDLKALNKTLGLGPHSSSYPCAY